MKLERVRARAFGGLENFDSGPTPLGDLNVVVGPNESGKTTFFHLLHSIIFGLYPASKDQHPYAPWSGRDLDLEAEVRLECGEKWVIQRKLATTPTARLTRNESAESLRNQTLPCASHVTREVFHQVFALTLAEVASLESQAWSEIQDRLIGGMGARDLVPARSVAEALEEEARRLWRPDRRGKQEIRVLQEQIHGARKQRRASLDADRLLRESIRELERTQEERRAVRLDAEKHGLLIERITKVLPIQVRMDQAARLEEEAGPPGALDGFPADPEAKRADVLDQIAALRTRLCETQTLTENTRAEERAFLPAHQMKLDASRNIEEIGGAVAAAAAVSDRLSVLGREIQSVERRIESATLEIFERALSTGEASIVRQLSIRDLHDRVRDAGAARDRMRDHSLRATLGGTLPEASPNALAVGLVAALAAAGLLLWPATTPVVRVLGGLLALGASVLLARWGTLRQAAKRQHRHERGSGSDAGAKAAIEVEETIESLGNFLSGLPVRSESLGNAGPELVSALTRLQELLEDLEARTQERNDAEETLRETDRRLAELGMRLELELPPAGAAAVHVLQTTLREAEEAEVTSKRALAELDRLALEATEIEADLSTKTQILDSLDGALSALGDGDIETGMEAATRMRRAGETADAIRAELERTHPNLDELMASLDQTVEGQVGDGDGDGDDALARARAAEKECSERIATLTGQITGLEHTCARAAEQATADQIDGEIDALENEVRRLEREHDRKIVLAHAVREADARFREEHQPDVVRRASGYLATITDGRYDRILVGDSGEFYVRGAFDGGAVDGEAFNGGTEAADGTLAARHLSTGAREQLYLAVRLAIMGHLDQDRERLPVFIDEALVNWDAARRGRGFQVLRELSETRQVFVMTCHEPWADELIEAGANRIDLT